MATHLYIFPLVYTENNIFGRPKDEPVLTALVYGSKREFDKEKLNNVNRAIINNLPGTMKLGDVNSIHKSLITNGFFDKSMTYLGEMMNLDDLKFLEETAGTPYPLPQEIRLMGEKGSARKYYGLNIDFQNNPVSADGYDVFAVKHPRDNILIANPSGYKKGYFAKLKTTIQDLISQE